jgi:glucose uptake protein
MKKPFTGEPVPFRDYFKKSTPKLHMIGLLGGAIWGVGSLFNFIAAGKAGYAISYGLGQGATLIAALWGVFIWKEFKNAKKKTNLLLAIMFILYVIGLYLIIISRLS